jgi:MFS family permease
LEAVLLSSAALLLLVGLTLASASPVWVATAALAAVPLALWWRSPAGHRLRTLMQVPDLRGSHLSLLAETTALGAAMYLFPFYLQNFQGAPAVQAGLVLLTLPAGAMISSPIGGFVVDAIGPRPVMGASAMALAVALAVTAPMSGSWTALDVTWRLALIGATAGVFAGANQTMSMSAAPAESLGIVGASSSMTRQLGFAFGPAFATAVWASLHYSVEGLRIAVFSAAVLAGLAVLAIHRPAVAATHA